MQGTDKTNIPQGDWDKFVAEQAKAVGTDYDTAKELF